MKKMNTLKILVVAVNLWG